MLRLLLHANVILVIILQCCCPLLAGNRSVAPPINDERQLGQMRQRSLLVYSRHYGTPCYADYVPTVDESESGFSAQLAANEFEPVQIGLYVPSGAKPATKIRIDVDIDIPHTVGFLHYVSLWQPLATH